MYRVSVDDSGSVSLPRRVVAALEKREMVVASTSPQHVLLAVDDVGEPCLTAAIGAVGVADVLSFFNMFRKTGILYFDLPDGAREVYFQEGEIIYAVSARFEEDIGEILCELGKLERSVLSSLRGEVDDTTTLSQLLVRRNIVAARDLWLATRHQVETIVYNLFACTDGGCYFVARELDNEEIVRLSMSTQNLIMEGLRRVDERQLYLRKFRSMDAVLEYSGKSPAGLDEEEKRLISMLYSVPATVAQMVARSGMSEFDALRVLYQLADKKMLEISQPEEEPLDGEFAAIFEIYNGVLTLLCQCVSEKSSAFIPDVNCFMRDVPYPLLYVMRGIKLEKDGSIDGRKIVKNLSGLEKKEQKKLLVEALNELVYMECSLARRVLGAQAGSDLIRRVQEITARVRSLLLEDKKPS